MGDQRMLELDFGMEVRKAALGTRSMPGTLMLCLLQIGQGPSQQIASPSPNSNDALACIDLSLSQNQQVPPRKSVSKVNDSTRKEVVRRDVRPIHRTTTTVNSK